MKKMCPKGKGRVMAAKGESIRTEKKKNLCGRGRKSKRKGKKICAGD